MDFTWATLLKLHNNAACQGYYPIPFANEKTENKEMR